MAGPDRFSLEGQYALVIGGTSGIGRELAMGFLQAGARVVIAGSNQAKLDQALVDLGAHGAVFGYRADVRDLDQLHGLIGITLAHHGHLDLLVNCQGITRLKPAEDFTPEVMVNVLPFSGRITAFGNSGEPIA